MSILARAGLKNYSIYNLFIVLMIGFSSGLPLALTATALQGWLTDANVDIVTIGMFSLVTQPYVYKFLWAPILDRYSMPFLGYRTGWIYFTQLILVISIISISFCDPLLSPLLLASLALIISFSSATQDIAFDAYRTELLKEHERGVGSVIYVYGYRIAMIVSGGGALFISYYIGWRYTYIFMALLLLVCSFFTLLAKEPVRKYTKPMTIKEVLKEPFKEFFSRPGAILLLLLLITYKLGEAFSMALTTPFLIKFLGFTTKDVGAIAKTMGVFATLIGLSAGGSLINRLGLYGSLYWFGILQAITNLLYLWLTYVGHNYSAMAFTIFMDQLCGGMGTAALMVLLMSICNQKYTATQFAMLSALAALGRVYVGPVSGFFVASFGWAAFYFFSFVMCLPGLIILKILKDKIINHELTPNGKPDSDSASDTDANSNAVACT